MEDDEQPPDHEEITFVDASILRNLRQSVVDSHKNAAADSLNARNQDREIRKRSCHSSRRVDDSGTIFPAYKTHKHSHENHFHDHPIEESLEVSSTNNLREHSRDYENQSPLDSFATSSISANSTTTVTTAAAAATMFHSYEEEENERLEREHYQRIINAFKYYRTHSMFRVVSAEKYYHNLPPHHKALIPSFLPHLDRVKACIAHNYEVIRAIIKNTDKMFENADPANERRDLVDQIKTHVPTSMDMDKVKTTLKQFVRDWSREGADERRACYSPIIKDIEDRYGGRGGGGEGGGGIDPSEIQILVPGAGLGRLAYEIAKRGYSCQGNEWSLFMLFASNFILNKCRSVDSLTLYPYVHQFSNNKTRDHQVEPIRIPDVSPADLPENAHFSMAAGDFLEVYRQPEVWDVVATAFFLDTAHNVIAYVETIFNILRPGGIWINLGPLLYHFADMPNESSIELSYEDLRQVILQFGFVFLKEDTNVKTTYTQNPNSMLKYEYECVYFVVEKPELALNDGSNQGAGFNGRM